MTTPVTFNTAARIIRMAYEDAGIIQEGQDLNADKFMKGMMRLQDLMSYMQTRGLKLWLWTDLSIPLVAGQGQYTLGPAGSVQMTKPVRAWQAYFLDSNNIRTPLVQMAWEEWLRLSQVTQQGAINSFFVDKQLSTLNVAFWLVPDATAAKGTAHLLCQQQVTGLVSLTDSVYFPVEWFLTLRWGLAYDLCTGQPDSIVAICKANAEKYRQDLEDWDVEDASTTFVPDSRVQFGQSDFR